MKQLVLALLIPIASASFSYASDHINTELAIVDTDIGEFVAKKYITFPIYEFDSTYFYDTIKKNEHNNDTPEKTIISFASAIHSLDIDWFLRCWDPSSRDEIKKELENEEFKEKYLRAWETQYQFDKISMRRIIDRDKFIIVEYDLKKDTEDQHKEAVRLIKIDNKWFVTRKFFGDLVFTYYIWGRDSIKLPEDDFEAYFEKIE